MLAQECNLCRKEVWCVLAHTLGDSMACQSDWDRCAIEAHYYVLLCFQNDISYFSKIADPSGNCHISSLRQRFFSYLPFLSCCPSSWSDNTSILHPGLIPDSKADKKPKPFNQTKTYRLSVPNKTT